MKTKVCKVCGQEYQQSRSHQKTCSPDCERKLQDSMRRREQDKKNAWRRNKLDNDPAYKKLMAAQRRKRYRLRTQNETGYRKRLAEEAKQRYWKTK